MTQMYVIIASGGSYDDAWSSAEFVTSDEKLGQHYVDRKNSFRDTVKEARMALSAWGDQHRRDNPRPIVVTKNNELREWATTLYAAQQAYKATFSEEIQKGLENNYDDTYWEIGPIEVLQ
jgi:hypothetical protein